MASSPPKKLTWAQLVAQPPPTLPDEPAETTTTGKGKTSKSSLTRRVSIPRPLRPRPVATQPGNLFLRLPGELRNEIYSLTLLEEKPIVAITVASEFLKTWQSEQPTLALTCRQLREEVMGFWVAGNAFVVCPPPDDRVRRSNL